ncbi:unnamed protein product [Cylindrotheca closterium]|uniref:Uncharacterized protein n=1 Tax=Cylindrotheca closterium TaxID=2856 RepID=A0AAD2G4I4_9STRA|nr:unnamed protein product [Cylindrotheca closterium]
MSTCFRTALRLSRSLEKTSVFSRNFASLGSCGDWSSNPSHDAMVSSPKWNNTLSASTKIGKKESADKTDLLLDSIFSRYFPLPHADHSTPMNSEMASSSPSTTIHVPLSIFDPLEQNEAMHVLNRNARGPKKANKGSRPCSRIARRKKKNAIGKRRR